MASQLFYRGIGGLLAVSVSRIASGRFPPILRQRFRIGRYGDLKLDHRRGISRVDPEGEKENLFAVCHDGRIHHRHILGRTVGGRMPYFPLGDEQDGAFALSIRSEFTDDDHVAACHTDAYRSTGNRHLMRIHVPGLGFVRFQYASDYPDYQRPLFENIEQFFRDILGKNPAEQQATDKAERQSF